MITIEKLRKDLAKKPADINLTNQLVRELCREAWKNQENWTALLQEAIDLLKKALKVYPENTVLLTNLGCVLSDFGSHGNALRELKKAEKIGSNDSHLFYNIAVAMMNLDARSRSNARDYFARASSLKPCADTMEAYFDCHAH